MSLTLFEHPLSPYARKVKICLYEKNLDFTKVFINPGSLANDPETHRWIASSPRREVPTLVDGDDVIFDSTIILEFLEEKYPKPPMQPAGASERARVRMLEELCDGELEAVNWGLMEILIFKRADGEPAGRMTGTAAAQLARIWGRLERELDGREWMNGDRFGRGDAAVYPHIAGSQIFGFEPGDECPRLRAWAARCSERPSVARDSADVGTWMGENLAGAEPTVAPPRVRQYRDHRLEWMMKSGGVDIVLAGLENGTIMFAKEPD